MKSRPYASAAAFCSSLVERQLIVRQVPMVDPTQSSDHDLLQRMEEGDEGAFLELYRRRQAAIYRFALHMSGSQQVAEDVTQDVFLALMREPGRFEPQRGSLAAYLYGIARNCVREHLEQRSLHVPLVTDEGSERRVPPELLLPAPDPLGDLTRQEDVERVRQAVLALPAHYREVVVLCDLEELDYARAAAALGCAVGTVRSRLHRARSLLLNKLRTAPAGVATPIP
jgi:RNA polymerase sigma-70 factor, ECF subfamily